MLNEGKQNITLQGQISCQSTFFFGVNEESMAKLTISRDGDVTFSVVGLGENYCQSKVFVSNQVTSESETIDFNIQEQQCFFFATYGEQHISFSSSTLLSADLMNYYCGNGHLSSVSTTYSDISCYTPGNPSFVSINTTNQEIPRSGTFDYSTITDYTPYCPSSASRSLTPTPIPDPKPSKFTPPIIAGIVIGGLVLIALSIFAIIYLERKRRMKVEAYSDSNYRRQEDDYVQPMQPQKA